MTGHSFQDFLHRSDTLAGVMCEHLSATLVDVEKALDALQKDRMIAFNEKKAVSGDSRGHISLADLAVAHRRIAQDIEAITAPDQTSTRTDTDIVATFHALHHHAMDLEEVIEQHTDRLPTPALQQAAAVADRLSTEAMALIGFTEAFKAGQDTRHVSRASARAQNAARAKGRRR